METTKCGGSTVPPLKEATVDQVAWVEGCIDTVLSMQYNFTRGYIGDGIQGRIENAALKAGKRQAVKEILGIFDRQKPSK